MILYFVWNCLMRKWNDCCYLICWLGRLFLLFYVLLFIWKCIMLYCVSVLYRWWRRLKKSWLLDVKCCWKIINCWKSSGWFSVFSLIWRWWMSWVIVWGLKIICVFFLVVDWVSYCWCCLIICLLMGCWLLMNFMLLFYKLAVCIVVIGCVKRYWWSMVFVCY